MSRRNVQFCYHAWNVTAKYSVAQSLHWPCAKLRLGERLRIQLLEELNHWLHPMNFDAQGRQKSALSVLNSEGALTRGSS
jgi:hypothetical protein